jgi:hypothetical protein
MDNRKTSSAIRGHKPIEQYTLKVKCWNKEEQIHENMTRWNLAKLINVLVLTEPRDIKINIRRNSK